MARYRLDLSKYEGSWSGMRKYLEQEMTSESFHGRLRYDCTTYCGMDGNSVFRVFCDDVEIKRFSHETVNGYFIEKGIKKYDNTLSDRQAYWDGYWFLLDEYPPNKRTEYTDYKFCKALEKYRNSDISVSIRSESPIVLMFALFDRRVGKRTLVSIKDFMETQPQWLREIYSLRCNFDGGKQ